MSERKVGKREKVMYEVCERRTASKKVKQAYKEEKQRLMCVREREREQGGGRVRYIAGLSGQSAVCQI